MTENFKRKIEDRIRQLEIFSRKPDRLVEAIRCIETVLRAGGKLLIFGNGGSSTQASHFAAELVNKFYFPRPGLAAIALTTDMANVTSIANDMEYRFIFSRQVEALGRAGDVALGLTTSGTSANVLEGLKCAHEMGLRTVGLCGRDTEGLEALGTDIILDAASGDTPVIQEMHLFFIHMMAETLERNFFGDSR